MTKGRAYLLILLFLRAFLPGLLLFPCPAFLSSCTKTEPLDEDFIYTSLVVEFSTGTKAAGSPRIESLDIFVFNEAGEMALDSYERIDDYRLGAYCNATSTSGKKHIVLIANCPSDKLAFSNFNSYEDLSGFVYELGDDNPECPLMCGEADFYAGKDKSCTVNLKPLLCEIVISRINTSSPVNSISVRLRNINTRATVLDNAGFTTYGLETLGKEYAYQAGLILYCYPYASEGGMGSPHTEISVTCRAGTDIRTYSITVNEGKGIERNSRYVYSINISTMTL